MKLCAVGQGVQRDYETQEMAHSEIKCHKRMNMCHVSDVFTYLQYCKIAATSVFLYKLPIGEGGLDLSHTPPLLPPQGVSGLWYEKRNGTLKQIMILNGPFTINFTNLFSKCA